MPISVITGLPGHGKTLRMVSLIQEAAEKSERPIYVCGLDGLIDGNWTLIDDPTKWRELPDGSLIFVDEAWKWFGHLHDARGAKTPAHVLDLAEHRHRGFDFVWTTQSPAQIYPFARTLIAEHTHVLRKAGTGACELYNWPELQDDVKGTASRNRAHVTYWMHPKKLFGMYKSATLNTIKPKLPWKSMMLIPALLSALAFCVWYAVDFVTSIGQAAESEAPAVANYSAPQTTMQATETDVHTQMRMTDPLAYIRPRVPGLPWTAPAYDAVPFADPPRYFCYISYKVPGGTCRCVTDQNTTYYLDDALCRVAAVDGVYDPIRRTAEERKRDPEPVRERALPAPQRALPATAAVRAASVPYIGRNYEPPPG